MQAELNGAPKFSGVPGNFPLINFFEISMQKSFPWGGYGANPYPKVLTKIWGKIKDLTSGGVPYSEGPFVDINGIICAGFYWDKKKTADESVKEYVNYYFTPEVLNDLFEVVKIFERTLDRHIEGEGRTLKILIHKKSDVKKALSLVERAEKRMPSWAKSGWRWKIIKLRAVIDNELVKNKGRFSKKFDSASDELSKIYHAENAGVAVIPMTKKTRMKYFSPDSNRFL